MSPSAFLLFFYAKGYRILFQFASIRFKLFHALINLFLNIYAFLTLFETAFDLHFDLHLNIFEKYLKI